MSDSFLCGHPRTPENSTRGYVDRKGNRHPRCAFCQRVRASRRVVDRQLARWKRGDEGLSLGQKIAAGLVR